MEQPNHQSVTSTSKSIIDGAVALIRQVLTPTVFEERSTILVPVRDDGWSPNLRCGEFAVVETTDIKPEDGAMVCIRNSRGAFNFVKLRLWDEKKMRITPSRRFERPYWSELYGRQRVGNWTPDCNWWAPGGYVHMADGPIDNKLMRSKIVGRVIGVLGANDRTFNWARHN